jgi:hypothetical protein
VLHDVARGNKIHELERAWVTGRWYESDGTGLAGFDQIIRSDTHESSHQAPTCPLESLRVLLSPLIRLIFSELQTPPFPLYNSNEHHHSAFSTNPNSHPPNRAASPNLLLRPFATPTDRHNNSRFAPQANSQLSQPRNMSGLLLRPLTQPPSSPRVSQVPPRII